eukprot:CAMPEP_0195522298 /NCGR_PEP_ID=MMETSP0794_2-20130614/20311_1 /TAXON_ID=515487 /ORGANISM="Stephanopyxis turris, Strain CCMP 815" /LENGTH=158 /DNA_ID=CAMNT_0040652019 /DNA_START=346 /DNA_END=822 /DNA_ORIENTATION=+
MSDEPNKHRIPFAFLNDIQSRFMEKYGFSHPQTAIAFSMNEEFSPVIQDRMNYYNSGHANVDKIDQVQNQLEEVKGVMVQNIEKVLERGEKIELLVDKTDRLNQQAFKFENSSRTLRRTIWWKKVQTVAILTAVVALVGFIVGASACGGLDFHNCRGL